MAVNYNKVEICGVDTTKLPVISEKEKLELIKKARLGDKSAREKMITCNLRLVLSVVQKFSNRGENLDDLFAEAAQDDDFSEDMIQIRDKIVSIRNLDEEIAKNVERNKIQLSDIQEDIHKQKQEIAEIESDLLHLLDSAEEKLR